MVIAAANMWGDQVPSQDSVLGVNRARDDTRERAEHPHFEIVNMAAVLANHLLPMVGQDLDGRLVSHGP